VCERLRVRVRLDHDGDVSETVDLIISDVRIPGLTGLEIVEGLRALEG